MGSTNNKTSICIGEIFPEKDNFDRFLYPWQAIEFETGSGLKIGMINSIWLENTILENVGASKRLGYFAWKNQY